MGNKINLFQTGQHFFASINYGPDQVGKDQYVKLRIQLSICKNLFLFSVQLYVVSETLKNRFNRVLPDNLYYFRDSDGNEVDLVCDQVAKVSAIEVKSGQTLTSDFFKGLDFYAKIADHLVEKHLVYGG
jgi:hypothetical protein